MLDHPRLRGVHLVAALRMNGLWTARSALRIAGLLDNHPFAADRFILCNHGIDDVHPLAHLVIVCVSVRAARRQAGLNPLIDSAQEQDPQANDDTILTRLLGGASQGEAAPGQIWLRVTNSFASFGAWRPSQKKANIFILMPGVSLYKAYRRLECRKPLLVLFEAAAVLRAAVVPHPAAFAGSGGGFVGSASVFTHWTEICRLRVFPFKTVAAATNQ
nr:hypothetical protein HK105_006410 [Polyrhizophydium stewartii]